VPWLSTGYVEIQRARCLTTLGDHRQAAQLFRDAIADIPPSLRRDRGVYVAREAMAHANANDPEQAADAGMRALAIAQITHSGRITTELRRLDTALRRWKTVPRASEFRDAFGGAILHETRTRGRERGRRP
jgi:tetratricopeptide (TPR) repeat protein